MDIAALFARLQLRPDADEKELRRAYARELKTIDQETQPEAFQQLRGAYEQLQNWLQIQRQAHAQEAAAAETEEPRPPELTAQDAVTKTPDGLAAQNGEPTEELAPDPNTLGRQVLDDLITQLQSQTWTSRDDAEDALLRCLDDPRLVNIDARRVFEWGVAHILASGWRPGHEFLFPPAAEVFSWNEDRSRLLWFGQAGRVVDAAITEMALFDTQEWDHRERQKEVIRRLRNTERPPTGQLLRDLPVAEMAAATFPNWLHVIAKPDSVRAWREWETKVPAWRRKLPVLRVRRITNGTRTDEGAKATKYGMGYAGMFVLMILVGIINSALKSTPPPKASSSFSPYSQSPYGGYGSPAIPTSPATMDGPVATLLRQQGRLPEQGQLLPKGIKPDADPGQARIDAAYMARQKPSSELCMDASDLARMNPATHERGDLGAAFDKLIVNCVVKKVAALDINVVAWAMRREQMRADAAVRAPAYAPATPPAVPVNGWQFLPAEAQVPAAASAPPQPQRLVTEDTGLGLKYQLPQDGGRMSSKLAP